MCYYTWLSFHFWLACVNSVVEVQCCISVRSIVCINQSQSACVCSFQPFPASLSFHFILKLTFMRFTNVFIYCVCVYVCVFMLVCVHAGRCPRKPEEGIRSSETRVTGVCEHPEMGARNQTPIFYKSKKCSQPLNHLPSPCQVNSWLPNMRNNMWYLSFCIWLISIITLQS